MLLRKHLIIILDKFYGFDLNSCSCFFLHTVVFILLNLFAQLTLPRRNQWFLFIFKFNGVLKFWFCEWFDKLCILITEVGVYLHCFSESIGFAYVLELRLFICTNHWSSMQSLLIFCSDQVYPFLSEVLTKVVMLIGNIYLPFCLFEWDFCSGYFAIARNNSDTTL